MSKPTKEVYIEGNKGGDYLKITPLEGNLLRLEVGNCCVITVRHIVPVEFLTILLTEATMYKDIKEIITEYWGKNPANAEFAKSLAEQVKPVSP